MLPANTVLVKMSVLFCLSPFDSFFGIVTLFFLQIRTLVVACYSESYCLSYFGGNLFFFMSFVLLNASRGLEKQDQLLSLVTY